MPIVTLSAMRAETDGRFNSILFDGRGIGRREIEARTVDEAAAALESFAAELRETYAPPAPMSARNTAAGFYVAAHWPRETVTAALELLRDGQTIEAAAAAVGVSVQTVRGWASGANCADVLREFETEHGPLKLRRGPRPIAR